MMIKSANYLLAAVPMVNAWADKTCNNYIKLTNARFPYGAYDGGPSPAVSNAQDVINNRAENGINGLTMGFPQNCGNGGAASEDVENYFDIDMIHTIGHHTDANPAEWIADIAYGIIDIVEIKMYVPNSPQYRGFPVDERVVAFSGLNDDWTSCPRVNLELDLMSPGGTTEEAEYAIITFACSKNRANKIKLKATYPESMWPRFQFYEVHIEESKPVCKPSTVLTNARFTTGEVWVGGEASASNGINGLNVPVNCVNADPDFPQWNMLYAAGTSSVSEPGEWLADITAGVSQVKSLKYYGLGWVSRWNIGVKAYTMLNGAPTECDFMTLGSRSRDVQDMVPGATRDVYAVLYTFDCHNKDADGIRLLQTSPFGERLEFYEVEIDVVEDLPECQNSGKFINARFNTPYDDNLFPAENAHSGQYIMENCKQVPDKATREANSQTPYMIMSAIGEHYDNNQGEWEAELVGGPKNIKKMTFITLAETNLYRAIKGFAKESNGNYHECRRMTPLRREQDPLAGGSVTLVDYDCHGISAVSIMFRQTIAQSQNNHIQLTGVDFEEAPASWSPSTAPTSMADFIDPTSVSACKAQAKDNGRGNAMCHLFRSCFFGIGNLGPMKCPNTCIALKQHYPREMCGANYRFASSKGNWWRVDEPNMQVCYKRGGPSNSRFPEVCTTVDSFIDIP